MVFSGFEWNRSDSHHFFAFLRGSVEPRKAWFHALRGRMCVDVPMPWSICEEIPRAVHSLLSGCDGELESKKAWRHATPVTDGPEVEILHVAVSTTRRALVGDELENKTEVQEQRLRLRTTVCVLLTVYVRNL